MARRALQGDVARPDPDVLALQRIAGNQAVTRLLGPAVPTVQRCGEKGCGTGKCGCGGDEREDGEAAAPPPPAIIQRQDAAPEAAPQAAVLVDDDQPVPIGGMRRTEFMDALRDRLFTMCDAELSAVGRSSEGCPYLTRWVDHYAHQPATRIERSITLWTGESATTAAGLQEAVVRRVRGAVRTWVATGEVTGIPEQAPALEAAPGAPAAAGSGPGLTGEAPPTPPAPAPTAQRTAHASRAVQRRHDGEAARVRSGLGAGAPLDAGVRSRLEPGFGRSFAGVRVHTDAGASALADGRDMRAFTVGSDIVVGSGNYAPGTLEGDALLAHELAHTVQQDGGRGRHNDYAHGPDRGDDEALEQEADGAAAAALGLGTGRASLSGGRGLRLQGCSQKAKACPKGYQWYPTSTIQWGSFGCTCMWSCRYSPPTPSGGYSDGPAIRCPPGVNCADPYDRVPLDYTKKGYGAAFTPMTGEPACGCFPLDIEGKEQTDAPLMPVDLDMTNVVGPGADMAAGAKARRTGKGGGGGAKTDPTTGARFPGSGMQMPHPTRSRMIEAGMYTANLARRLDPLFEKSDPAVMRALDRTMDDFQGADRMTRVNKILDWAEKRPSVPDTVQEGATFGKGGTGSVAEVVGHPELASKSGAGRAGGEAAAMLELELIGIPTVYIAEGKNEKGQQRLILKRIDGMGSKDIIGRPGSPPADRVKAKEGEGYVTERTISDLRGIRQTLADNHMNVGDFQFIVRRSDGAVFLNDPTGFTPNSKPSGDIDNIIDRFAAILRRRTSGTGSATP